MPSIEKIKLYTPLPQYRRKQFNWRYLVVILVTILVTGVAIRIFDIARYNNSINQLSQQDNLVETQEGKDIRQLINSNTGTLTCPQFLSSFAQQVCQTHNQQIHH